MNKTETAEKLCGKLLKFWYHPATVTIMIGWYMVVIPVTIISIDSGYDYFWLIMHIGVFLDRIKYFIDWRITKLQKIPKHGDIY